MLVSYYGSYCFEALAQRVFGAVGGEPEPSHGVRESVALVSCIHAIGC